ncbi:MAG: HlyD family efflux transporter periplasmic adaptor subunit [Bacteroidia bacterium]
MKYTPFYFIIIVLLGLASCSKNQTTKPERKDIVDAVFASGAVSFADEYVATANVEGFIKEAKVKEGDAVAQGALLFQLSNEVQSLQTANALTNYEEAMTSAGTASPKLLQLEAQVQQAKQTLELDRKNMERYDNEVNTPKIQQIRQQLAQAREVLEVDKKNYERYEAQINAPKIVQLNKQLAQAKQTFELDKKNYERYEALLKTHAVSKLEYDKIQLQYENGKNNVQIAEKNLAEKEAALSIDLDKVKLQYENSKNNVAIWEKNLAEKTALARLDDDKVRLQYENSKSNVAILEKALADSKKTLNQTVKTTQNQVEIQKQYFGDYSIYSAMMGTVLELPKQVGELARRGEMLARIGGGKLITKLFVAEEDINQVQLGQKVALSLNTDKNKTYQAKVTKIYPDFNKKEQSFVIEVEFDEPIAQLRSGTQVQANIIVGEKKNALVLPKKFLRKGDKVLKTNKEEVFIKVGIRNLEWVEILEGIDEKTEVLEN